MFVRSLESEINTCIYLFICFYIYFFQACPNVNSNEGVKIHILIQHLSEFTIALLLFFVFNTKIGFYSKYLLSDDMLQIVI